MASASMPWFPIRTARLLLREFHAGDLDDIHAYASDQNTVRYMEWGPNTPEVSSERLRLTLAEQEQWPRRDVNLAAQLLENGRVIGSVRLGLDGQDGADLGYVFGSSWWGVGYGYEAASAVLAAAFGTLELHRVWATCDARNAASVRLLEKLGMRQEGTMLQDRKVRDGWRDTGLFALLNDEWQARPG
jgi:[ribosomal protein S5]-alanine N-acetyltransferase